MLPLTLGNNSTENSVTNIKYVLPMIIITGRVYSKNDARMRLIWCEACSKSVQLSEDLRGKKSS